jgi:hypothetical protein
MYAVNVTGIFCGNAMLKARDYCMGSLRKYGDSCRDLFILHRDFGRILLARR